MGQQNGASNGGVESLHGHLQPRNFLRPCLLLLLGERPAYGYELREQLAPMSLTQWDMGTVYRALNTMEEDGLVCSSWERSAEGPRRRRYDITVAGRSVLDLLAGEMSAMRDLIAEFLDRYRDDLGSTVTPWLAAASPGARPAPGSADGRAQVVGKDAPAPPQEIRPVRLARPPRASLSPTGP